MTDEEVRRDLEALDRKIIQARELAEAARETAAALQGKPIANANRLQSRHVTSAAPTAGQILSWNASLKRLEWASSAEPAAHVLATTASLGTKHTVSGLTARQVLIATSATAALFRALQDADIPTTLSLVTASSLTSVGALVSGSLAAGFTVVTVPLGGTGLATLTDHAVLLGSGTGAITPVALGAGQVLVGASGADPVATDLYQTINILIDGGGAAITTGIKARIRFSYACEVIGWGLGGDNAANEIVLDVWLDSHANYPPTVADTMVGGGNTKPTLSGAIIAEDDPVDWDTTSVTAGYWMFINVDSVGGTEPRQVTLALKVKRT